MNESANDDLLDTTKNETNQTIIPGTLNQIDNIDFGAVLHLTSQLIEENEKNEFQLSSVGNKNIL